MMGIRALLFAMLLAVVTCQSLTRPNSLCGIGGPNSDEGIFHDLTSTAPAGYRVGIHSFSYGCGDTSTFVAEYYFKTGSADGYEEIRWPWILHFSETFFCNNGDTHTYEPITLVIGEVVVGHLTAADNADDLEFQLDGSPFGDAYLTAEPGLVLAFGAPFSTGSTSTIDYTANICFTYTLDNFGAFARTKHGFTLHGFDGEHSSLLPPSDGHYTLLSHESLELTALLEQSRHGHVMSEARLVLAEGHSFHLDGMQQPPMLEITRPEGSVELLALDELVASKLDEVALDFEYVDSIRTQLFVSSFASKEACLQDPALSRYFDLGDLEELEEEQTWATARVTLKAAAYEVTLVVLQSEGDSVTTLKVLSHRRVFVDDGFDQTTLLATANSSDGGLMGVTSRRGRPSIRAEDFVVRLA